MFSNPLLFLGLKFKKVNKYFISASYIQVCGRRNPDLEKCVINSIENLKERLMNGIPELSVPAAEPLIIEEMVLLNSSQIRAVANNCKVQGLSNFKVKYLKIDLKNQLFDLETVFEKINLDLDYDVNAKIIVPINQKGSINLISGKKQIFVKT